MLADAKKYAESRVSHALQKGERLLADAAAAGRSEAEKVGPAQQKAIINKAVADKTMSAALKAKAAAETKKAKEAKAAAKKAAELKAKQAKRKAHMALLAQRKKQLADIAAKKLAAKENSPFRGQRLKATKNGVFGAVDFGLPKSESLPSAPTAAARKRNALERFSKFGPKKNIYGRMKSCLKDIAAHFDEKDIYESKKMSLLQKMSNTKSLAHAQRLRGKLQSLETWHQMMQKKFLMSAAEQKQHEKRVEALFDEHLPQELKDQLKQNKVAKRAQQKLPFPNAQAQAMKILRSKRKQIQSMDRLKAHGHKRMLRPEINDKGFPSMDPISSSLREKLWRNVETQDEWSTDARDMERAENIITAAHKAHGDFVEGPIAEPMLRGKLYHPATEKLGVPNFLTKFPWPIKEEEKITMNDKVKVEQTYHQTW